MLGTLVKRAVRYCGMELRRYNPATSESARFMAQLSANNINLVLDIGANAGQFGRMLRESGYRGRIVSFEPLSQPREKLLRLSQNDPLWEVAPRAALGSEEGEIEIHVAGNSVSSSALNMLDAHANAAPGSSYIGIERVPLKRLDTFASEYLRNDSVTFIKIDTQGYEDRVLEGASELLKQATGVQLELSLVELYAGQKMYDELIRTVESHGFALWGLASGFADLRNGRTLQIDATFFR